jgi:hypothetical protein
MFTDSAMSKDFMATNLVELWRMDFEVFKLVEMECRDFIVIDSSRVISRAIELVGPSKDFILIDLDSYIDSQVISFLMLDYYMCWAIEHSFVQNITTKAVAKTN